MKNLDNDTLVMGTKKCINKMKLMCISIAQNILSTAMKRSRNID